jgi:hypothetical protein
MPDTRLEFTDTAIVVIETGGQPTRVPDSECDTPEKLLSWVLYFIPRAWVTKDFIEDFITTAIERHSMKVEEPLF